MLVACVICHFLQKRFHVIPSFLFLMFLGPLFFGFGYRLSVRLDALASNWQASSFPSDFGDSVVIALFMAVPFGVYLLAIRLTAYFLLLLPRLFSARPR
jgi:hypothetical protein